MVRLPSSSDSHDARQAVGRDQGLALGLDLDGSDLVAEARLKVRGQQRKRGRFAFLGRDQLYALQHGLGRASGHDTPGQAKGFL